MSFCRYFVSVLGVGAVALGSAACDDAKPASTSSSAASPQQVTAPKPSGAPSAGTASQPAVDLMGIPPPPSGSGSGATALSWTTPEGWQQEKPSSPMRKAQYRIAGPGGDAELIVYYFGPQQGGAPMANAERWAGQFTLADGRSGKDAMRTEIKKVGEIEVLTVEVAGTYAGGIMSKGPPQAGQALLGAVARGPDANWFFKMTGPEATVTAQRTKFMALVDSIKSGG